jgi:cysteine desulfurase / selenocysteine lyase
MIQITATGEEETLSNMLDVRSQFPIFSQAINGHPLVYLDSAATTQKPQCVMDAMTEFYEKDNANVKRGMHVLAERSTELYEAARRRVQTFINAKKSHECIFTKNATEGINLVARSWGEKNLKEGDVVLLSLLEHHSNIVPWLQLKEKIGIEVDWVGITNDGILNMQEYEEKLKTKNYTLITCTCVSNVLGTITPYREMTKLAHENGSLILLDAAQLAAHSPIDVQEIDCDFLVFSGHKVYGPTGIGVLYGKEELLKHMPPFLGGGTMIQEVFTDRFTPTDLPEKFEAGTPPIAEAVGLHRALAWITEIGWPHIQTHEKELMRSAIEKLEALDFITVLGPKDPQHMIGCMSFVTTRNQKPTLHPHDLTEYCGRKGVCLRAGHHCCQPLHDFLGVRATTRMSIGVYTTTSELQKACDVLKESFDYFTPWAE